MMFKSFNHFSSKSLSDKLLSGGIWAGLFKVIAGVFGLLVNIMLVNILSPDDVGVFFLTHSMVTVFSLVAQFGLPQLMVRLVAESLATNNMLRIKSDITLALMIACITCVITGSCVVLFAGDWVAIHVLNSPLITVATGIVSFWIIALTLQVIFVEIFRGLHDLKMASLFGGAFTNILLFVILYLYWLYGNADYYTVVQFSAGTAFTSVSIAGYVLYRRLIGIGSLKLQFETDQLLSDVWPLWVTTLTLYVLVQADLWIVAYFLDSSSVALYGAAARLIMMLALLVSLTYAVLPPIVAELNKKGDYQRLQRVLRAFAFGNTMLVAPIFIGILLFPSSVLNILFGEYYVNAGPVLVALAIGKLVNICTGMRGYILMLTGHGRLQMKVTIFAGILNILFCIVGVIHFGILGVAIGAASALILQCIFEMAAVRIQMGLWTHLSFIEFKGLINEFKG